MVQRVVRQLSGDLIKGPVLKRLRNENRLFDLLHWGRWQVLLFGSELQVRVPVLRVVST